MGNFGAQVRITSPFFALTDDDEEIGRQAVYEVLNTRRGTYRLDPEYGFMVSDLVNAALTPDQLAAIPGEIEAAVKHLTDIVAGATCAITASSVGDPQGARLTFKLDVEPNVGGPWAFNLDVTAVSVDVLRTGV